MNSLYPYPEQETSTPCAIAAVENLIHRARGLSPILPRDLKAMGVFKVPVDMLIAAMVEQAEENCALQAKLERISDNAAYWCEANGITDEDMVEDLVSAILDVDQ
jgi:hypothetical protein